MASNCSSYLPTSTQLATIVDRVYVKAESENIYFSLVSEIEISLRNNGLHFVSIQILRKVN